MDDHFRIATVDKTLGQSRQQVQSPIGFAQQHYMNFTHRFAFDPAFFGTARGGALLGFDGFSLSSFGVRYGVTRKLQISVWRSPTFIARPIQFLVQYNWLSEADGAR